MQTGEFPADLAQYQFHDAAMRLFIQLYRRDETVSSGFHPFYRVGTESTSHSYSPEDGGGYCLD